METSIKNRRIFYVTMKIPAKSTRGGIFMDEKTREFLQGLVKAFDEIAGRITYFITFSDAFDESRSASDCSKTPEQEDDEMKYKGVKIKQRKDDGRWYARVKIKENHYYDIYGRTQKICYEKTKAFLDKPRLLAGMRRKLEAEERKKRKEQSADKLPKRVTVKDWYEYWMKAFKIPNCRDSTLSYMKYIYNNHISKLADKYIGALTGIDIQAFLAQIPTSGIRKKTYTVLKDMVTKAYAAEIIPKNPFLTVVPPKHKSTEQRALEPEEQERFICRAEKSEYFPIYALMLYEGLRTAEAKAIRHCDIKEDCIIVRSALTNKNQVGDTKTGNVRRVPIFAAFKPIADKLRSNSTDFIIANPNKHTANDEYRQIMQELGMNYNMYALRHTFATNCARAGIVTKQVSIWMGHSNVSMTLKYYTNISRDFEEENKKQFDTKIAQILKEIYRHIGDIFRGLNCWSR